MKLLIYPCSQNDQNTPEFKMTKTPFYSQKPLIPTKIHIETNNHIQAHINTHNK